MLSINFKVSKIKHNLTVSLWSDKWFNKNRNIHKVTLTCEGRTILKNNVRALRKKMGLIQAELGKLAGGIKACYKCN